ncbi:MAG: TolC family protein [Puniceicoccales bacterium]|nr:TolC family protein [Puniceicoccales bacterium]
MKDKCAKSFENLSLKLSLFLTLFALGGCGSFQEFVSLNEQKVREIAEKQRQRDGEEILENALSSDLVEKIFCDHPLDLYELLDLAFERNPSTKIAWRQAMVASAQKTKTESAFYPRLGVSLNAARVDQLGGMGTDKKHLTTSVSTVAYPQVEISYSLLKFGAHREQSHGALSTLKAANFQFNQTLQDVAYAVELGYFALNSAIAIVHANEQNLEDAKVALDAAKNRHQSGLANRQDLLKAQAAHSAAVFELENSRSAVEMARARLARVMGVQVSEKLRIAEGNENEIPDVDNMENLIRKALEMRQDMRAKWETLEAKEHALKSKAYDRYPEVVAGLSASRKKIKDIPGMYNNFEAYIGLKWDIFDGHLKESEQLMAYEEMKIARQQLKLKALDISSEVWEYFHALKSAIQKLDSAKETENCALEAFNYTKEAYGNGLSSFTDLLTSQNALSVARKQLVCAKNDLAVGWVQLAYCTGKILEK